MTLTLKDICARCSSTDMDYPAISRFDNETEICSDCGRWEALFMFYTKKDCPPFENGKKYPFVGKGEKDILGYTNGPCLTCNKPKKTIARLGRPKYQCSNRHCVDFGK